MGTATHQNEPARVVEARPRKKSRPRDAETKRSRRCNDENRGESILYRNFSQLITKGSFTHRRIRFYPVSASKALSAKCCCTAPNRSGEFKTRTKNCVLKSRSAVIWKTKWERDGERISGKKRSNNVVSSC